MIKSGLLTGYFTPVNDLMIYYYRIPMTDLGSTRPVRARRAPAPARHRS